MRQILLALRSRTQAKSAFPAGQVRITAAVCVEFPSRIRRAAIAMETATFEACCSGRDETRQQAFSICAPGKTFQIPGAWVTRRGQPPDDATT